MACAGVLLTACGSTHPSTAIIPTSSPHQIPSASASSPASTPVPIAPVVLVVVTQAPSANQAGRISLFNEDGKAAGSLTVTAGVNILGAAGARIFVQTPDGTLKAIRKDGSVETLGSVGSASSGFVNGLAASPDGGRWVWAVQSPDTTSQTIHMAGDGTAPRTVATLAYPTVLAPYSWTPQGIFMRSEPMDWFGYTPFQQIVTVGTQRLDPATNALGVVALPNDCAFSDMSVDGTIACLLKAPSSHAIRIVHANGQATNLSLATPRFNYVGDAFFSTDGSMLAIAGATGVGNDQPQFGGSAHPQPEQFGTDLVRVADGSISRFGPTGVRPAMGWQSWLPDGKLVLWRPDTVGGPPGLYVLDPHGAGTSSEIRVSGSPLGYLSA